MGLLVVADERCDSVSLAAALGAKVAANDAVVFVVAPVLASPLHFLAEDEERQREDARERLDETLNELTQFGIAARGMVGSDDPLQAIGDALARFPANEILFAAPTEAAAALARARPRAAGAPPLRGARRPA